MNVLYKFTSNILLKNKTRTIVTIIGVALTSALLFGVGLFASTFREEALRFAILENGPQHVIFRDINENELNIIKNNQNIKQIITKGLVLEESNVDLQGKTNELYSFDLETFYKYFALTIGEYPKNNNEVIISRNYAQDFSVSIGDILKISQKEYKIVGVYSESILDSYRFNSYYSFTNYNFYTTKEVLELFDVYVIFNKPSKTVNEVKALALKLGFDESIQYIGGEYQTVYERTDINYSVLKYYGNISNYGEMAIFILSLMLILSVLSIACILIIYNSFSISVMERKKLFGIFSSVGATPAQILKSVFFEAMVISLIAIPLGFLISLGIASTVILILNQILEVVIDNPFKVSAYPLFILISLFFILIMVFLSALFPAKRASETSPIDAIKLSEDIKYNRKNVKTNKLIFKLFGIEAVLALKNIKRNKKRYRITVLSLCVSIVLFITTSTFTNIFLREIKNPDSYFFGYSNYDIYIQLKEDKNEQSFIDEIKRLNNISEYLDLYTQMLFFKYPDGKFYTKDYLEYHKNDNRVLNGTVLYVLSMDDSDYKKYLEKLKIENNNPIFLNKTSNSNMKIFDENKNLKIELCNQSDLMLNVSSDSCYYSIENINLIDDDLLRINNFPYLLVINKTLFDELANHPNRKDSEDFGSVSRQFVIKTDNAVLLDKEISKIIEKHSNLEINYENPALDVYKQEMAVLGLRFSIYSFIFFVTMIAITSVINTIHTSIKLRRREFAVLRSVGLSPNGFNKMIRFESVFFGLKSLLYGVPISLGIIHLISQIFLLDYTKRFNVPINYFEILIAILVVVIVSFITMMYAVRKIKKENILDGIRNESI